MFNRGHRALLHAISLAILFLAPLVPALAAGTIPFSMTQQLDKYGVPLSGCQLYIIQAGTTSTPQNAYKDTALSLVQPNPMTCDASGRLPQFFLADGQIKIRLLDKLGNPQVVLDNILVIGPSSGGGSGATIDPTTILTTGDLKVSYGPGILTGFVRANGRTIGSATSGASERANADTQALFQYLWGVDTSLAVSGGRGVSAAADWAANKTIVLPDWRGRGLGGLADMGNTATTVLTVAGCGSDPTVVGIACGFQTTTLNQSALPNVGLSVSIPRLTSDQLNIGQGPLLTITPPGTGSSGYKVFDVSAGIGTITTPPTSTSTASINGAVTQTAVPIVSPTRLATIYIKL